MNKWLNWENNKNKLKDGDLILVEFGIKEPIHEYQSFIVKQQNNNLFDTTVRNSYKQLFDN